MPVRKPTKKAIESIYLDNGAKKRDPKTGEMVPYPPSPRTVVDVLNIAERIAKKGETKMTIVKDMVENIGYSEQQATERYEAALRYLMPTEQEQEQFREKMMAKILARYERLYERAIERDSLNQAREILDSISKLYGLSGGNRVQIAENAEGEKIINIQFD